MHQDDDKLTPEVEGEELFSGEILDEAIDDFHDEVKDVDEIGPSHHEEDEEGLEEDLDLYGGFYDEEEKRDGMY